jgi:hypothetical protein
MSALVKTLNVFPKERSIVARERTRKAYNVLPYLSGKPQASALLTAVVSCGVCWFAEAWGCCILHFHSFAQATSAILHACVHFVQTLDVLDVQHVVPA